MPRHRVGKDLKGIVVLRPSIRIAALKPRTYPFTALETSSVSTANFTLCNF